MRRILLLVGLATGLMALAISWSPAQSAAEDATYVVDDPNDAIDDNLGDNVCHTLGNKCTLRAAIQEANIQYAITPGSHYTITLPGALTVISPPKMYSLTITGSGEDLSATGDLDIKANLVLRTSNGLPALVFGSSLSDRIFHIIQPPVGGPISVTFQNIWIAQGFANDGGSDNRIGGGGLLIDSDGSVTMSNGRVLSNTLIVAATKTGLGAGIFQNTRGGTLTLKNMQVNSNRILGGDFSVGAGGGVFGFGTLLINDSAIVSNVVTFNPFLGSGTSFSGEGGGVQLSCCITNTAMTLSNTLVLSNAVIVRGPTASAQFGFGGGVIGSVAVTLTNSTVQGNLVMATGNVNNVQGGGVLVGGRLLMQTSSVTENRLLAQNNASFSFAGGGMRITGAGRILTSTFSRNTVRIGSAHGGSGGGLSIGDSFNDTNVLLDASLVENNLAANGGGIETQSAGTGLAVRNSDVDNNAALTGGGILNSGILSLTNSTIYSNLSFDHGAGLYNSGSANVSSVTFNNNTVDIDGNSVGDGGALYVSNGATLFLRNSLLTGDFEGASGGTQAPECFGDVISDDYNLIAQTPNAAVCNVIGLTAHNLYITTSNVLDFQLLDHGGATPTLALLPGSPAIGAGNPAGCRDELSNVLTKDQRGVARLGLCDIGAYEFVARLLLPMIRR